MKTAKVALVCLVVYLILGFTIPVHAPQSTYIYSADNFNVLLSENSAFNIKYGQTEIKLKANSNLNGSSCSLIVNSNGGTFIFTPENSTLITITYSGITTVKVNGTGIASNTQLTYSGISSIVWNFTVTPWLPIMFIFGMIGIVSMFFGGLNFISEMQKKHYYKALIVTTIAVSIGVSFVLAWLWS